jgi:hypothetical protein
MKYIWVLISLWLFLFAAQPKEKKKETIKEPISLAVATVTQVLQDDLISLWFSKS